MDQELDCLPDSTFVSSLKCSCDSESMIKTYIKSLDEKCIAAARILFHTVTVKFWELLFRQNIDLSTNEIKLIWTEEADSEGYRLYWEYLLFALENLVNVLTNLFGASQF